MDEFEATLAVLINSAPYEQAEGVEMSSMSRRGNFVLSTISDIQDEEFHEDTVEQIINHAKDLTHEQLISAFSLTDVVSEFNPEVFHFNEVLHAYRHERDKLLIILLSVFFESHTRKLVDDRFDTLKENQHAGSFYKDWTFKGLLQACRFFDVLEEPEYDLINKTRIARNQYAHDFEHYRDGSNDLEQEGKIDDVVRLYEGLIGVEQSMTND